MGSGSSLTLLALSLPLAGLILVLAAPSADFHWEHHPSHFWLVLGTAAISTTLAFATSGIALRVAWAGVSLGSVPPLDDPTPSERASGGLIALAVLALIPFAFAAWRYARMAMGTGLSERGTGFSLSPSGAPLLLAVASAFTLLAEA